MRVSIYFIIVFFFSTTLSLKGQSRTIIGRVISENLGPLPRLEIKNSDTVLLGKTDIDGRFKINIPQEIDRLLFGYIGMEWTEIKLRKDCDTIEVVMLYRGTYDFMSFKKIDKIRKKSFDELPGLHSDAVKEGLFATNTICYERVFKADKPSKPVLDSISKVYKSKSKQIKGTFNRLALGDTIRIPYSGSWRDDGTDRTTLHLYSNGVDGEVFNCIIRGVITDKNKRNGGYNLVCRVIDCKDCNYDNIVLNGKDLKVGETIEYNMKFFKVLNNN
ncbi:hypothetical protein C3K47_05440 [Solitalea longa]|uniref:Carboxypeptidase-like regulatory domain-containing protein n=1 Tax=Solitalea longa TaxID=2079460 RepID=A0A2S5A5W0_9SPHI|nr:hypothetical protein [Solitalea longa]POY37968.1 hypothetical protein C3K47_05440 [Solitalea longa]